MKFSTWIQKMSTKQNKMAAEFKSLEHQTFKVPFELLNKKFRATQKVLDKDIAGILNAVEELNSSSASSTTTVSDVLAIVDSVSQRTNNLKRKAHECFAEEEKHVEHLRSKVMYVKGYASRSLPEPAQRAWRKQRLDRMLIDHLFRAGNYKCAQLLAKDAKLEHMADLDFFKTAQRIEDALQRHDTGPCLSWCQDNKSKLKRIKSCLEFRVKIQDFVEMIKVNRRMEAIRYARNNFSSVDPSMMAQLKEAMALLAFKTDTKCAKYQHLFSDGRWAELIQLFRNENLSLHQLSHCSLLSATIQAGLSALKTPQCYMEETYNMQCPVCSRTLNELAEPLPYSHHAQSQLICALSREPINEHNPPLALPNGYVYGERVLQRMSEESEGYVTCPKTSERYSLADTKKVFVM